MSGFVNIGRFGTPSDRLGVSSILHRPKTAFLDFLFCPFRILRSTPTAWGLSGLSKHSVFGRSIFKTEGAKRPLASVGERN